MVWMDGIIAMAVLLVFFFFIYARLAQKYPFIKDSVASLSPSNLYVKNDSSMKEDKQQIWNERREGL